MDALGADVQAGKGSIGKFLSDTAVADEAQVLLAQWNESMSELLGVATNLKGAQACT